MLEFLGYFIGLSIPVGVMGYLLWLAVCQYIELCQEED